MKILLQLSMLLLLNSALQAQQYYFAYVQTDNKQPFYLKINNKLLSSSASGYVVIPKLTAGNYTVTIGFPKEQYPQQTFSLNIVASDAGFLLKDFGAKGWGLFNLETMQVAMNNSAGNAVSGPVTTSDDVFSNTLAGAANTDLSVPKKSLPVVVVEPKSVIPVVPIPIVVKDETIINKVASENAIKKINTTSEIDGKSYTYVDRTGSQTDTINVFIAAKKIVAPVEPVKEVVVIKEEKQETKEAKPTKFLDIDMANPSAKSSRFEVTPKPIQIAKPVTVDKPEAVAKDKPVVSFNSDCKAMANDNDFLKIRKKMAASGLDDEMVDAAKKSFKATCYSVEQIKNLSTLFLNDAGKYNFFDAAYPHIYDSQNFKTLQTQLSDQYYISRFKAMIRN